MSGITFMVDKHGQKTAAVIDLRKHEQLQDFHDAVLAKARLASRAKVSPASGNG